MTVLALSVLAAAFAAAWWADAVMPKVIAQGIYQNKEV